MFNRDDKIGKFKFNSPENYGINDEKKALIKKGAIYIGVVLIAFLILFFSFLIPYTAMNKDIAKEEKSKPKPSNQSIFAGKDVVYNGNHRILPNHNRDAIVEKLNNVIPVQNLDAHEIIRNIYFSDEKQVYLTFDDGPSQAITPQILDILNYYDVKATFFVLGKMASANPDLIRREYEEGHYIANHGYSHTYSKIYESKDTVYEEYMETEKKIQEALGNPDYHSYLFRFPGGSSGGPHEKVKEQARELLRNENIAFTNWNCLTEDAAGSETKEACLNSFFTTKEDQNSLIILMHDAGDKQQTVEALPELIEYLKSEGYEFKTFYDIYK